jgi:hypothetical protein
MTDPKFLMRSFPRPPRSVSRRPEIGLSGVATQSGPTPSPDPASNGSAGVDGPVREVLFDLVVAEPGLVIRRCCNPDLTMPSLVPWPMVECTARPAGAQAPDEPPGNVLDIEVADPHWLGGAGQLQLRVPPTDLAPFLEAVAAAKAAAPNSSPRIAGGAAGLAVGMLVGLHSGATRWMHPHQWGEGERRHGLGRRRVVPVVVGLLALAMLAGSTSVSFVSSASGASRRGAGAESDPSGNRSQAAAVTVSPNLPAATSTPDPDPPTLASSAPLASHEIFGYAPYWTLPESSGFDVQELTTLAYFSVDANPDGTLDESGSGWNGYESQDLVNLVTRSHAAGRPGGAHGHRLQPELARRHHLRPQRRCAPVGGADRSAVGQEPRRRQLRLRGGGKCGSGRTHRPDHPGIQRPARRQSRTGR